MREPLVLTGPTGLTATLYCGDCLEVLPTLAAGSVDAVVTDPVWPDAAPEIPGSSDPHRLAYIAFNLLPRGTKRLSVQLGCDSDPRFLITIARDEFPFFRVCWLEYVQPNYKGRLLYTGDVAYFFGTPPTPSDGHHLIPGRYIHRNGQPRPDTNLHPCARQLSHVAWTVDKWTAEGETILDPFMGSGTTGVACAQTGRNFIGIEIDPGYFEIAVKRIRNALAQPRLL